MYFTGASEYIPYDVKHICMPRVFVPVEVTNQISPVPHVDYTPGN